MLVRFLSFIASLIGTGRYKTVLLSCLVLVLSLSSFAYLIFHGSGGSAQDASSSAVRQKDGLGTQSPAPQLGGNRKQETKQELQTTQPSDNSGNPTKNSSQPSTSTDTPKQQNQQTTFDFTLGTTSLTLAAGNTSSPVTASTSDNTAVSWQVATDNDAFVHVALDQNNTTATSLEIQTSKDAPSGKQITITLTARDATRNINLSKTITVTIQ